MILAIKLPAALYWEGPAGEGTVWAEGWGLVAEVTVEEQRR